MPHVRKQEYKVPSKEYELEYVEVIQRHHKRTPYASNTFSKEDISWDCSDEGPYHYAKDANGLNTAPIYWQAQTNTQNPFEYTVGPGFVNSTCQFPSITLDDAYIHGKDLRGVYHGQLKFLPNKEEKDKYKFRVTNNVITSQTLSGLVKGLFTGGQEYDVWIQSDSWDSLEPSISCALKNTGASAITDISSEWGVHLNRSLELRKRFFNVSGIEWDNDAGCEYVLGSSLRQSLCKAMSRLGNYEYAYKWRMAENSTLYSALTMGAWFRELQGHMNGKIDASNNVEYSHNVSSLPHILRRKTGDLSRRQPMWPGIDTENRL
ncbi:hypothetical protein I312_105969 [Cryptococcus bacillisporus CA1280]|uniref:uncharacterized protein n=1 Tax=Cryptococcus bacillisporus CA1280 TaxID=1296109 RepID=UPI0033682ABB